MCVLHKPHCLCKTTVAHGGKHLHQWMLMTTLLLMGQILFLYLVFLYLYAGLEILEKKPDKLFKK